MRALPALPVVPNVPTLAAALAGARRWSELIPSWVVLGMILLATLAVCTTVTMRTRAELQSSLDQHQRINAEIDALKKGNAALRAEVSNLQSDPVTIETAARARLNMVRANEIVVAIEARNSVSRVDTRSFVR